MYDMDCEVMRSVATFAPLQIYLSVFIIISIIAIPLVIWVVIRFSRNPLYHINTRVLLIAHGIALLVHLTGRIFYHGWDLYNWLIIMPATSPCDIISTSERCFFIRFPFNAGIWFCLSTTPAIAIERWIATKKVASYQRDRRPWLCLLIQFGIALVMLSFVYSKQTFGDYHYYCLASRADNPFHVLTASFISIILQVVSVFVFRNLIKTNMKLKNRLHKTGSPLTKRYQVEESLRSLQILSQPVHFMFACQFAYSVGTFLVVYFNSSYSRPVFYFLMEICVIIPEYSIAFAFTVYRNENKINVQSTIDIKRKIDVNAKEAYFNHYKKAWDK